MSVVIIVLLLVTFGVILWCYHTLNKKRKIYANIPGPSGLPIVGIAFDFKTTKDVLDVLLRYQKQFGDVFTAKIGPFRRYILVSEYKFLECILSSTKLITKSHHYDYLHGWLGSGLLTSSGTKWKSRRRILTPAFHFQILEQFIEVFEKCGDILVNKFSKELDNKSFDIYPYVTLCTLDIICESIMGISICAQENSKSDYVQSVRKICEIIVERSISPLQMCPYMYPFTKNYWKEKKALKILHKHSNDIITARRKELDNPSFNENHVPNGIKNNTKTKKPFLDLLLRTTIDGVPLTQEEIREEVDTFMFEGHDTTASAISFTLFCLSNNAEVQQKAFEEQKAIFGDTKNVIAKYADLQNMKYLEQVIKESLRLYPSVPFYNREITEDVYFEDKLLPKGDTIIVFAVGIQRNPKYFKDPEKFNPDRFADMENKLPYANIPFSAGPRNCIGQKFAMLEMKSTISKILRNYQLLPAFPLHELHLVSEIILKSSNGIRISLQRREK